MESIVLARHMRLAPKKPTSCLGVDERNYHASLVISTNHANAYVTFKIIKGND